MIIFLNGIAIIVGSILGPVIRRWMKPNFQAHIMYAFTAVTFAIGIMLLNKGGNMTVATLALLIGAFIGEQLELDDVVSRNIMTLQDKVSKDSSGSDSSCQILISALVLLVCSTTGMIGAVTTRLTGDYSVLATKALLDFVACLCFSMTTGYLLAVSALPVLIVLFAFYAITGVIGPVFTEQMIGDFCACGGMIQIINALKIVRGKEVPVINFLPALPLAFVISWLWTNVFL